MGVARDHALEGVHNCGAVSRLFGFGPIVPRHRVHDRGGDERPDFRVVRIFLPKLPHGVGVSLLHGPPVRVLVVGVTFVTNSICAPSRAVILTGKYGHSNGQLTNVETFDGSQQTFPKLLQQAGYQTAMFGKWHLKSEPTGFDAWQVLIGQGPYYNPPIKSAAGVTEHVGYTTNIITDLALDWLQSGRDAQKPFMMMCQHKAPHRRWDPGPDHLTMYDDVEILEPDTLFDDYAGRGKAATQQTMSIARDLTERDLKLVPPEGLTAEQLEVWNAAYEPKNDAFRAADSTR